MTARSGWQDAVEHVNAPGDGLDEVDRLADPHQVTRPIRGQHGRRIVEYLAHGLMALAHRQAT